MEDQKQEATLPAEAPSGIDFREVACPECATPIRYLEGCFLCPVCGYSKCE